MRSRKRNIQTWIEMNGVSRKFEKGNKNKTLA
jgi:hypothetical protein